MHCFDVCTKIQVKGWLGQQAGVISLYLVAAAAVRNC